jgi:AraC-like DNA-binding protein
MSKFETTLYSGAERLIKAPLWAVLQLHQGVAYVRGGQLNEEIQPGGLIVVPPNSAIIVLASQLGAASLRGFSIQVGSLSGLLTVAERKCLEGEVVRECSPFRQLPASHSLAARMNRLFENVTAPSLPDRLGFIQSFAEWTAPILSKAAAKDTDGADQNPRLRLHEFLNQMPESELIGLSLGDLAKHLCCCDRHASRLFQDVCGCSFRKFVSELRLKKACQMLSDREYKIIDIALDSGHSSLAQFNFTFKTRFRMTPSEWRDRHLPRERRPSRSGWQLTTVAA